MRRFLQLSVRMLPIALGALFAMVENGKAEAGVLIAAGTDSEEHGSVFGGTNQDGWLFMQRALENIAPSVTNGNMKVVALGVNGSPVSTATLSAFNLSALPGLGWSYATLSGASGINNFFNGVGLHTVGNTGIVMVTSADSSGGLTALEDSALTSNATGIDNFLGAGGGAFTQSHSYGWLSTLVPGLTTTDLGGGGNGGGLSLTAAGSMAFPGLTNADLSSGPFHGVFGGSLGGLTVLATANTLAGNPPAILGISAGSVTNPGTVPEPTSALVWSVFALGTFAHRRRKTRRN